MPPLTRRRHCNIVTGSPGPIRNSDNATTLQKVFNIFLHGKIVEDICTYTNLEATDVVEELNAKAPSSKQKIWANVDPVKLRAFFGVSLMAEALHCQKEAITEMWTTDESIRRAVFTASMS